MKNYLVITIGTRDVQIKRNIIENSSHWFFKKETDLKHMRDSYYVESEGIKFITSPPSTDFPSFLTVEPRAVGEYLNTNYDAVAEIIDIPLILPTVYKLLRDGISIDYILTIYTNQESEFSKGIVKKRFFNNDTLFFNDIIVKKLKEIPELSHTEFDEYGIFEQVANIDFQYKHFGEVHKDSLFLDTNIKNIYLLPQGGIDQINHAITLQLIQRFKHKVKLFQQPDGLEPVELNFTHAFLTDLNKQKIFKHLEDYDFGLIDKSISSRIDKRIYHIAQYGYKRLNLQYDLIEVNRRAIEDFSLPICIDDDESKIKDTYLAAKINFHQGKYTEFLWKIYTLNESLYKIEIKKIVGNAVDTFYKLSDTRYKSSTPWEDLINSLDRSFLSEIANSKMPNGYSVDTKNPNRASFKILLRLFVENKFLVLPKIELYEKVSDKLEALSSERNGITHRLGSTSISQINAILNAKEQGYSCKVLLEDLDEIFDIKGFDIYDNIKLDILNLLNA